MPTIREKATTLTHKKLIKGGDAARLMSMAEKDEKITRTEVNAMARVAKLPDDRFEKTGAGVHGSVEELRGSADWAKDLLDAKLEVKSSVSGLTVSFDKHVTVEPDDGYGASYHRFLNVQLKGKTAAQSGKLSFEYGDFKVTVPIKKGQSAESIFNAVESRVLQQQNGAMSIRGGLDGGKVLNASIGFGIHRTAPMTPLERVQHERNMLWADLVELQMEEAPDVLTKPLIDALAKLDAKIAKMSAD